MDSQLASSQPKCKPHLVNIILADHEAIFRTGAAKVLAVEDDLRIVGQPQCATRMLNALAQLRAHVLLVSNQFLPALLEEQPLTAHHRTAVVVIAEDEDPAATFLAMGSQGVVYRSIDGPSLVEAVRRVASGETFIHSPRSAITEIREDTAGAHVVGRLSEIELGIVAAVFRSCTNREIAEQLGTTEQAVKYAMRSVFDKTGVSDRLELALFVFHHRMLEHAIQSAHVENGLPLRTRSWKNPAPKRSNPNPTLFDGQGVVGARAVPAITRADG